MSTAHAPSIGDPTLPFPCGEVLGLAKLTGISALWVGLAGNALVIAAALFVTARAWAVSPLASLLVLPVAAWTCFASAIVAGRLRAEGRLGS
jgi:hypothetical protein